MANDTQIIANKIHELELEVQEHTRNIDDLQEQVDKLSARLDTFLDGFYEENPHD